MPKNEQFQYFDSSLTTFNVLKTAPTTPDFDQNTDTVTYHGYFEIENKTGQTVENVSLILPYIWVSVRPGDDLSKVGPAGPVALDLEDGVWSATNFNGIEGLNLVVTARIVPQNHPYNTFTVEAGTIASSASLTDVLGPSSADERITRGLPSETLDSDDIIPAVNVHDLDPHERVAVDLVFHYEWTLDGQPVDYNALRTAGSAYTISTVENWPV
jgi:hypothetical protein